MKPLLRTLPSTELREPSYRAVILAVVAAALASALLETRSDAVTNEPEAATHGPLARGLPRAMSMTHVHLLRLSLKLPFFNLPMIGGVGCEVWALVDGNAGKWNVHLVHPA